MQIQEIIKAAIPLADEKLCEHILWSRTPYPCGEVTAKSLYREAYRYKRARDHGFRLCDFCNQKVDRGRWVCDRCDKALRSCSV